MTLIERDDRERAVEALCETYPETFFLNGRQRRPLKSNILQDIKADIAAHPDSELRFYNIECAIDWYCTHVGHHKCCSIAGVHRVDLKGNRVGTVTEKETREESEIAQELFDQTESRERPLYSYVVSSNDGPPAPKMLKVDTTLSNDGLITSIEQHLASLKTPAVLPEPKLQKELPRSVVLLLIDELKTLDARLTM
jgi:hypothetical protein